MDYDTASAALEKINARAHALGRCCPRVTSQDDVPAYEAWLASRAALAAEAKALGFIRIFDGSYKLNLTLFA